MRGWNRERESGVMDGRSRTTRTRGELEKKLRVIEFGRRAGLRAAREAEELEAK